MHVALSMKSFGGTRHTPYLLLPISARQARQGKERTEDQVYEDLHRVRHADQS